MSTSRHVAVLGAWITLLALAIDPFTQQIIHPVACDRAVLGTLGKVPRAINLTSFDETIYDDQGVEMSMLASIYTDLTEGDRPIDVQCPTGNCTFTQESNPDVSYQTLGFESVCVDVSEEVRMMYEDSSDIGNTWHIPRISTNETIKPANPNDGWWAYSADTLFRFGDIIRLVATMNDRGRIYFPEYWTAKQNESPMVSFTTLMMNFDGDNCEETFCLPTDMPLAIECKIWPAILTIKSRIDSANLYETTVGSEPLNYHADPGHGYIYDRCDAMPAQVLRDGFWEPCSGSSVETPGSSVPIRPDFFSTKTWYAPDCVWNIDYGAVTGIRQTFKRMYQNQTLMKQASATIS